MALQSQHSLRNLPHGQKPRVLYLKMNLFVSASREACLSIIHHTSTSNSIMHQHQHQQQHQHQHQHQQQHQHHQHHHRHHHHHHRHHHPHHHHHQHHHHHVFIFCLCSRALRGERQDDRQRWTWEPTELCLRIPALSAALAVVAQGSLCDE